MHVCAHTPPTPTHTHMHTHTHIHTHTHLAELRFSKVTRLPCVSLMPQMLIAHCILLRREHTKLTDGSTHTQLASTRAGETVFTCTSSWWLHVYLLPICFVVSNSVPGISTLPSGTQQAWNCTMSVDSCWEGHLAYWVRERTSSVS